HRKALESIGGFESVVDYLGDDYELGARIAKEGYVVALSECVVEHHLPDYSFRDYVQHQLRWGRSTRASRPIGYIGLVFTFGFAWAVLGVIVSPSAAYAWLFLAVTLAVRLAVAFTVGVGVLKDRELLSQSWLIPARDLVAVGIWLISFTGRRIVWRGNQF